MKNSVVACSEHHIILLLGGAHICVPRSEQDGRRSPKEPLLTEEAKIVATYLKIFPAATDDRIFEDLRIDRFVIRSVRDAGRNGKTIAVQPHVLVVSATDTRARNFDLMASL